MGVAGHDGQRIEARPVNLENLGVQGTGEVADIHALGRGGDVLRMEEGLQRPEILLVAASPAVHLRLAQHGGHVGAVQLQGLPIAHQGQGILEIGQIIISQHGEDGGYGVLLVELFQLGGAFVLAAHGGVHVVAGAHHFFREPAQLLNLVQGLQGLLVLLVLEVQVQHFVEGAVVVGEVFHHALIECDAFFRKVLQHLEAGLHATVPIIAAVYGHGLGTGLLRRFQVPVFQGRQCQVVPDGIVFRLGHREGLEQLPGLFVVPVAIQGDGVYEIGLHLLRGSTEDRQAAKAYQDEKFSHKDTKLLVLAKTSNNPLGGL